MDMERSYTELTVEYAQAAGILLVILGAIGTTDLSDAEVQRKIKEVKALENKLGFLFNDILKSLEKK